MLHLPQEQIIIRTLCGDRCRYGCQRPLMSIEQSSFRVENNHFYKLGEFKS